MMARKAFLASTGGAIFVLWLGVAALRSAADPGASSVSQVRSSSPASAAPAAPIRLARHPDYHAGRIAFSYLGDIWTADEEGTNPVRLTDNRGRDVYPRFSPDGRWIAFSSNRYGNDDVFVMPAAGGGFRPGG